MLSKDSSDATSNMIKELIQDREGSICFKSVFDLSHPEDTVSSGVLEFPATPVHSCRDILMCLDSTITTIGIENYERFNYEEFVRFLKKTIHKKYKIIITGRNIEINKFSR